MIALGIDIGITGAMCAVDSTRSASIEDLPVTEDAAGKRIAGRKLLDLVRAMVPPGHSALAVLEDVRPRPGPNTAHTMGSLMGTRRAIEAVLDVAGIRIVAVQPQTWKRFYALGADKGEALQKARTMYPALAHMLKRQKDHNRAEALLIAHYGLRTHE